jgi:hypothetical protein
MVSNIHYSSAGLPVTRTLRDFEQIIYADFEFVSRHGEHPDAVCLAWREEPGGQTRCLWRDQLDDVPPYRTDDRVLFVCFVANAELCCHLALNWPLPANVIDLSAEFRLFVNDARSLKAKACWVRWLISISIASTPR